MPLHRLHIAIALVAALVLQTGQVAAERPRRVGIVVTVKVNVSDAEARRVSQALGEAIRRDLDLDVIAGGETERRLPQRGLPENCVADIECRNELGRRLDAEELLMLVVLRLGEQFQIDATWSDIASGDVASRPKIVVPIAALDTYEFRESASKLLPHIEADEPEPPPPPVVVVSPASAPSAPPPRPVPTAVWITSGVSAAALVGGVVVGLSARSTFQSLEKDGCRDFACPSNRLDSLRTKTLTADILFGVSAAGATAALILYLTRPELSSHEDARPGVAVQPGPGDVGLAIGSRF